MAAQPDVWVPEINLDKGGHGGLPDKGEYIVRSGRIHLTGSVTQDGKAIRVGVAGSSSQEDDQ